MRISEIVKLDDRGRVSLPMNIRNSMGLTEGTYAMLVADLERHEIRMVPFADPEAKLAELQMAFSDVPGALAKAATILAEHRVDLLSTESRTLKRGEVAEWHVIADVSRCRKKLAELKRAIVNAGIAKDVELHSFE